jgi:hypothetical protein
VVLEADAAEGAHALAPAIELRQPRVTRLLVGLLPDEEDLVDRAEGVDLELVVGVAPGDEQLHVVVRVDERVALGERALDERLIDPVRDVEALVVPEDGGPRVVDAGRPADEVREAWGPRGAPPVRLVEAAVHGDRPGSPHRAVAGDPALRPREGPGLGRDEPRGRGALSPSGVEEGPPSVRTSASGAVYEMWSPRGRLRP